MKISIITVAGVSSRFNKDIPDEKKILKCLYYDENPKDTLIYQMLKKLESYDKIIIVGGYKYSNLMEYVDKQISQELQEKIILVENDHFDDLSSGYSLYLGIKEALDNFDEIDEYKYLFNSDHGMLNLKEPFKAIFNSGQTWKFRDMELLKIANDNFYNNSIEDTNLGIIQKYFDLIKNKEDIELIGLKHWVNCNTRDDYRFIVEYWRK